jgi:hypothetical protein
MTRDEGRIVDSLLSSSIFSCLRIVDVFYRTGKTPIDEPLQKMAPKHLRHLRALVQEGVRAAAHGDMGREIEGSLVLA